MGLSSPGIGSNLDVNSIVSQLMQVEARPLTALDKKESSFQAKISAFGSLTGALTAFQTALAALNSPAKFQAFSTTSADATVVSGSATAKAAPGSYAVEVTRLAQAQTISTSGQASTTAQVGDGVKTTLRFDFGSITGGKLTAGTYGTDPAATPPLDTPVFAADASQTSGSVVIDSSNNSLQGIRDAINKAAVGVTATIVSDGSATPSHLVLTSNKTGQASSMKVTVTRDPAAPPANPAPGALADLLAYDPAATQNMTQTTTAQDTALTVNGIAISGATKSIKEAIQGVTLNVNKLGSTTLTVARDTAAVESGVAGFVKAYNELDKTIKSLTSYDAASKTAGPLLGDSSVRNVQTQLRRMMGTPVAGTGGGLTTLSQVGIGFQKDGSLAVDSKKLQNAIATDFDDLAGLFSATGTTSDSLVGFAGSSAATRPGTSAVQITALATRGSIAGSVAPANLTITAGSNDRLEMTVNGVSASVTLAAGSYTAASLLTQVQSTINGAAVFLQAGIGVSVNADASGIMSITSNRYGSASTVSMSGNGAANLLGAPLPSGTPGVDVAGTIDGVAGTGSGQVLSGAAGSSGEGLKLDITGGLPGARGTVNFSQGYAALLNRLIDNFVGTDGLLTGQSAGLQNSIKGIDKARIAVNATLVATEARYRAQYSALDTMISKMNTTSTYLAQQLAQISNQSNQ